MFSLIIRQPPGSTLTDPHLPYARLFRSGFSALLQLLLAFGTTSVTLAFVVWISPPLVLALPVLAAFAWMAARLFGREQARISRQYVADMTHLFWRGEDFPRRLRHVRSFGRQQADDTAWTDMAKRLGRGYRRQLGLAAHGRLDRKSTRLNSSH